MRESEVISTMIVDTHAHTYFPGLGERQEEILANMRDAGVSAAIQIGTSVETSRQSLDLAKRYGNFFATVGWHPCDCQHVQDIEAAMRAIKILLQTEPEKIVGIGETGLDYHYDTTGRHEKIRQREFFARHADLAGRYDLPLVIHTRDAWDDMITCIRDFPVRRAIMHSYSDDWEAAQQLLAISDEIYFSFSGMLTYRKNDTLRNVASRLPIDRILVETDAPFLSPEPFRGRQNEPAFVRHTLSVLQHIRPEPPEAVEQAVYDNSIRCFRLAK